MHILHIRTNDEAEIRRISLAFSIGGISRSFFFGQISYLCSTYVDESRVVTLFDVVQHGRLVQARQVGHVLLLVELGRVHLLNVVLGHEDALRRLGDLDLDLVAAVLLDGGRDEAHGVVGDPDEALLRPFRLLRRVVEGVPVHDQVLEVGVRLRRRHRCDASINHFNQSNDFNLSCFEFKVKSATD